MNEQLKQYEIEQAKQKMGTSAGSASAGMVNASVNSTGMTNSVSQASQLKPSEKAKAQEDINKSGSMY